MRSLPALALVSVLVALPVPSARAASDPEISIGDVTMNEGNSGITPFPFSVTLSAASDQSVSVDWHSVSGTATGDKDFVGTSGSTLVFAPGETTKTISISVYGDREIEHDETFSVVLDNPVNATIADNTGVGTIVNDDACQNDPNASGPIVGTSGDDILCGTTYADVIDGGGGNDVIYGYGGADRISGGPGNDEIFAGAGPDVIDAGSGDDVVHAGGQADTVYGRGGADRIYGDGDGDVIDGGDGADVILGGWGPDRIRGGAGPDHIDGENDNDTIHGNKGNDDVSGGVLLDRVYGDAGNDIVDGGPMRFPDKLYGGDGSDLLLACDHGADDVNGGRGYDRARLDAQDRTTGVERRKHC